MERSQQNGSITAADVISPSLIARFRSVFDGYLAESSGRDFVPYGLHWCLAPEIVAINDLAEDGLKKTPLLKADPGLSRLWVGCDITFIKPLVSGASVTRSIGEQVTHEKAGASGPLLFIETPFDITCDGTPALRELRRTVQVKQGSPPKPVRPASRAELRWTLSASPAFLFRYSALTFNAHRIHYDTDYAVEQESLPGLLVHGPLQATLLLNVAIALAGKHPASFKCRAVSRLVAPGPFEIAARQVSATETAAWITGADGSVSMTATASFDADCMQM